MTAKPDYIDSKHWEEWVIGSAVSPDVVAANVRSLHGEEAFDYLLYSPGVPRRNDGRIRDHVLRTYSHIQNGGWWVSGEDLLDAGIIGRIPRRSVWGQFKPNTPRPKREQGGFGVIPGKFVKYEAPYKAKTEVLALSHPDDPFFWVKAVLSSDIRRFITEGAKKGGALVSNGDRGLALPGINGAVRTKDDSGAPCKAYLIPEVEALAIPGAEFYICFDQDDCPKTRQAVNRETFKLARLLTKKGCKVRVMEWNGEKGRCKGVDDLIATKGVAAFDAAVAAALPFKLWTVRHYEQLTYRPNHEVNSRYFPNDLMPPAVAKFIAIKGRQGTGKTKMMTRWVQQWQDEDRPILVITHRIQLVAALCKADNFGLYTSHDLVRARESRAGDAREMFVVMMNRGMGICIDSLRPNSSVKFGYEDWTDAIVIIDEIEQVLWHLFDSTTCQNHRANILSSFTSLIRNVLSPESNGKLIIADADISDVSIDFVKETAGGGIEPWILNNRYTPEVAPELILFPSEKLWFDALDKKSGEGKNVWVSTDAKEVDSTYSSININKRLGQLHPELKGVQIDSSTLSYKNHPAYGCVEHLSEFVQNYNRVVTSPVIETGASVDCKGHFDSVWLIANGVFAANSCIQAAERVRDMVPRYAFIKKRGLSFVAGGETSVAEILESTHKVVETTFKILRSATTNEDGTPDHNCFEAALNAWAKMAARHNAAMECYDEAVKLRFQEKGYKVTEYSTEGDIEAIESRVKEEMKLNKQESTTEWASAIVAAEELTDEEFDKLSDRRSFDTEEQAQQVHKAKVERRYGIDATPELVLKDADGWYSAARLHYYLTVGADEVKDRDMERLAEITHEGKVWAPDAKRVTVTSKVETFVRLGVMELITSREEFCKDDQDLIEFTRTAIQFAKPIKQMSGISIAESDTPIVVLRKFLKALGLKLEQLRQQRNGKSRVWVYAIDGFYDERTEIFPVWRQRFMEKMKAKNGITVIPNSEICHTAASNIYKHQCDTPFGVTTEKSENPPSVEAGSIVKWGSSLADWIIDSVEGSEATIHQASGYASTMKYKAPLAELRSA